MSKGLALNLIDCQMKSNYRSGQSDHLKIETFSKMEYDFLKAFLVQRISQLRKYLT